MSDRFLIRWLYSEERATSGHSILGISSGGESQSVTPELLSRDQSLVRSGSTWHLAQMLKDSPASLCTCTADPNICQTLPQALIMVLDSRPHFRCLISFGLTTRSFGKCELNLLLPPSFTAGDFNFWIDVQGPHNTEIWEPQKPAEEGGP